MVANFLEWWLVATTAGTSLVVEGLHEVLISAIRTAGTIATCS